MVFLAPHSRAPHPKGTRTGAAAWSPIPRPPLTVCLQWHPGAVVQGTIAVGASSTQGESIMAGLVRVDLTTYPLQDRSIALVVRACPYDGAYGRWCVVLDERTGALAACPFWYGTVVRSGPLPWEVRDLASMRQWMATAPDMNWRSYDCRCLAADQSTAEPGAKL